MNLETSSAFDINIIEELYNAGKIDKNIHIISNGFKRPQYLENICRIIENGFENTIPILDNMDELEFYKNNVQRKMKIGIRIASEEEPMFSFYTS